MLDNARSTGSQKWASISTPASLLSCSLATAGFLQANVLRLCSSIGPAPARAVRLSPAPNAHPSSKQERFSIATDLVPAANPRSRDGIQGARRTEVDSYWGDQVLSRAPSR